MAVAAVRAWLCWSMSVPERVYASICFMRVFFASPERGGRASHMPSVLLLLSFGDAHRPHFFLLCCCRWETWMATAPSQRSASEAIMGAPHETQKDPPTARGTRTKHTPLPLRATASAWPQGIGGGAAEAAACTDDGALYWPCIFVRCLLLRRLWLCGSLCAPVCLQLLCGVRGPMGRSESRTVTQRDRRRCSD